MDVIANYRNAVNLYNEGKPEDCLRLLLDSYKDVNDPGLKINYLLFLVILVDPVFQLDALETFCDEGMVLAQRTHNAGALSYFCMRKAFSCSIKKFRMLSIKRDITLAPGRINFALESDRDLFLSVSEGMTELKKEIDSLVTQAWKNADLANFDLQAHLHSLAGDLYSAECGDYLLEHLRHANLLHWLRPFGLQPKHVMSWGERREVKTLSNRALNSYLKSVEFYKKNNDSVGVASAYSNAGNHLRSIDGYHAAKKYLLLSQNASSAKSVVVKRDLLASSINEKNKNVPDYKKEFPRPVLRRNSLGIMKTKLKDWFTNTD